MFKITRLTPQLAHEILVGIHELEEQRRIFEANRQVHQAEREEQIKKDMLLVRKQKEQFEHEKLQLPIQRLVRWVNEGGLYHVGDRR